jgi:hypothetical protein
MVCIALKIGVDQIGIAIQGHPHSLKPTDIPHEIRPGCAYAFLIQPCLKIHLKSESKKAGHNMTNASLIPMVIDRPDL